MKTDNKTPMRELEYQFKRYQTMGNGAACQQILVYFSTMTPRLMRNEAMEIHVLMVRRLLSLLVD